MVVTVVGVVGVVVVVGGETKPDSTYLDDKKQNCKKKSQITHRIQKKKIRRIQCVFFIHLHRNSPFWFEMHNISLTLFFRINIPFPNSYFPVRIIMYF